MKQRKVFGKSVMATALVASMGMFLMSGCSAGTAGTTTTAAEAETTGTKEVLRVGMECAYAPFNWTQDEATTPDGSKAVKIYDSAFYA